MAETDVFNNITGSNAESKVRPNTVVATTVKQTSLAEDVKNSIFAETGKDLGRHLLIDCVIPRAKQFIVGSLKEGLDFALSSIFGDVRLTTANPMNTGPKINYTSYSTPATSSSSYIASSRGIVKTILFETREDALNVLDDLKSYIRKYSMVSILDYYEFCGKQKIGDNTDDNYGWRDYTAFDSVVPELYDGTHYILRLPNVVQLPKRRPYGGV